MEKTEDKKSKVQIADAKKHKDVEKENGNIDAKKLTKTSSLEVKQEENQNQNQNKNLSESLNKNQNQNKNLNDSPNKNQNQNKNLSESPNKNQNQNKNLNDSPNKNQNKNLNESPNLDATENVKEKNSDHQKNSMISEKSVKNENDNLKEPVDEEEHKIDDVYVERIINVAMSEEIRNFIRTFMEHREEILSWCNENTQVYANKINKKTIAMFFHDTKNLNKMLSEGSMNIDLLSIIIYFYNLYCTHNNQKIVNFNDLMANSHIIYRGLYENIDTNSKTFKNLLKEERKYKLQTGIKNDILEDSFWNYKNNYSYGINLIIGLFLTFLSGYYGALLIGYTEFTTRLICGIIFSYFGLILEVFIYIILYEKSEKIKKGRLKALRRYNGLYKKIYVSPYRHDLGQDTNTGTSTTASTSTSASTNVSTGTQSVSTLGTNMVSGIDLKINDGVNINETKKDK